MTILDSMYIHTLHPVLAPFERTKLTDIRLQHLVGWFYVTFPSNRMVRLRVFIQGTLKVEIRCRDRSYVLLLLIHSKDQNHSTSSSTLRDDLSKKKQIVRRSHQRLSLPLSEARHEPFLPQHDDVDTPKNSAILEDINQTFKTSS